MMALLDLINLSHLPHLSDQVLILISVLVLKVSISRFVNHEPLRAFQFYCQQLSHKVNNSKNSHQQQTIAGLVAIFVTLLPITIILWLFSDFVAVDYLWHGLLLYLALGTMRLKATNQSIAKSLVAQKNYEAKQILNTLVLRDTTQLSVVGLSKAAIEMQLLRTLQQGYVVAFIFLFFGPLAAFCYRLLVEMHYSWNPKLTKFVSFGFYPAQLVYICQWLPVRLFSLLLLLLNTGRNSLLFWRLSKIYFFQLNNHLAISLLALVLEVKLGGVAMYQQDKLRRISFNDLAKQPQATDIIYADRQVKQVVWLSLVAMITVAITFAVIKR
jgi:adenosylcobinamide-phosphate synthase